MSDFEQHEQLKRDFISEYEGDVLTMAQAARKIGKSRTTIWNWRQDDSNFDEAVEEAKKRQNMMRLDAVEDSVFKQIMEGDAAASVIIFWLKNLGKGKWRDSHQIEGKHEIEHSGDLDITELHELADKYEQDDA